MIEQEITLSEILQAREERAEIQNALLDVYGVPVVSFTMNMAGPVKVTALSHRAFLWGMEQLRLGFAQDRMEVLKEFSRSLPTGDEGYFAVDSPAEAVKALCVEIEETDRYLGRLFDMDVIGTDGRKLERGSERPCLVCGRPGRECASRRLHSVAELQKATASDLKNGFLFLDRDRIAELAGRALLEEVSVTPKPGLVDRANSGSHRDMDLRAFQASAAALAPYWGKCFFEAAWHGAVSSRTGADAFDAEPEDPAPTSAETFAALRPLGRQAERDMLAATGGVNTHKGAVFTLGILCGAVGRLWTAEHGFPDAEAILDEAAAMTRETLEKELPAASWNTAGEGAYRKYGARGIRGQVADGLPAVREISLPVFRDLLDRGLNRNHAAAVTLLHLIANVEDTNLLHRGGPEGAAWAWTAAAELLRQGTGDREQGTGDGDQASGDGAAVGAVIGRPPEAADKQCLSLQSAVPTLEQIAELDRQFIERNLSPGGCADLLAVTLFLDALCAD